MSKDNAAITEKNISRRDFAGWIIKGGLLATFAGMVLPALAYIWPVAGRKTSGEMEEVGNADDIPMWGGKKVIVGGSAMLIVHEQGGFKAFSAICTHLGCLVEWDDKKREILCPCHAGIFDLDGKVVSGPPPRPLPEYAVSVRDGKILVKV